MAGKDKHEWHVVSVDAAFVPRILFTSDDEGACHTLADDYWNRTALPGEEVFIACSHNRAVQVAKKYQGN